MQYCEIINFVFRLRVTRCISHAAEPLAISLIAPDNLDNSAPNEGRARGEGKYEVSSLSCVTARKSHWRPKPSRRATAAAQGCVGPSACAHMVACGFRIHPRSGCDPGSHGAGYRSGVQHMDFARAISVRLVGRDANQISCRRPWPKTRNATRHLNVSVGTTHKSIAAMASAWLSRNVRQV